MMDPTQNLQDSTEPTQAVDEEDDKTKRYKQAADYNASLIKQRQERGPFYVPFVSTS